MRFSLSTHVEPPTVTVTANGELDIFSARQVSRELSGRRGRECQHVLIDVSGVSFVDASALGVFARTLASVTADDRTMGFVAPRPAFRRLCTLTGLDGLFDLTDGAQRPHLGVQSPVARTS